MEFSSRSRVSLALLVLAVSWMLALPVLAQGPVDPIRTPEYMAQEGLELVNAADAYALGYTGAGVVVGVVDTGIDASHREFAGNLLDGLDLVRGVATAPGESVDEGGHGSHVAGIIAALRDGHGMHGVAYDARLVPLRADFDSKEHPDVSFEPVWRYIAEHGVPIVNASLGFYVGYSVEDWTRELVEEFLPRTLASARAMARSGTLIVFATGNETLDHPNILAGLPRLFPDIQDNWLAVTSVDLHGDVTWYGNYCGVARDWCLAAPGGEIIDPDVSRDGGVNSVRANTNGYIRIDGTSMAAPHVAGAAALVKQAFPYFEAYHLQQAILTTAQDIGDEGIDDVFGWGLLDAGKAVLGPAMFVRDFDMDTRGFDSTFGNDIDGPGALIKRGAGTLFMTGKNTYEGGTFIHGGSIHMEHFHVGQVLGITVHGDGSPTPLTTDDRADVSGTELALYLGTLPRIGQEITLIEAAGGVEGDFRQPPSRVGAIHFAAPHVVGNRSVVTVAGKQFMDPAAEYSTNQRAFLTMMDDDGVFGGGPLMGALAELDPGSPAQLMAAHHVSGDTLTVYPLAVDGAAREFHRDVRSRLFFQRTGGEEADGGFWDALWIHGSGAGVRAETDGNGPGFDAHRSGWRAGLEHSFGAGTIGLAYGDGRGRLTVRDRAGARGSVHSKQAGLYGSLDGNAWYFAGSASYGWHRVDSERRVAVGDLSSPAGARYEAATWAVEGEVGHRSRWGSVQVEPSLGYRTVTTRQPQFTETGEHGLHAKRSTFTSHRAVVGLRFYNAWQRSGTRLLSEFRLGYEREFGDAAPELTVRLKSLPGDFYPVKGTELGRDIVTVGLGLKVDLMERLALHADLDAAWRARHSAQSVQVGLRYLW